MCDKVDYGNTCENYMLEIDEFSQKDEFYILQFNDHRFMITVKA